MIKMEKLSISQAFNEITPNICIVGVAIGISFVNFGKRDNCNQTDN